MECNHYTVYRNILREKGGKEKTLKPKKGETKGEEEKKTDKHRRKTKRKS